MYLYTIWSSDQEQLSKHYCVSFKEMFSIYPAAAAAAKSLQSCPTLCDPIDGRPPGSSVPGIFQARVLEWGAIAFSVNFPCKWLNTSLGHVMFQTSENPKITKQNSLSIKKIKIQGVLVGATWKLPVLLLFTCHATAENPGFEVHYLQNVKASYSFSFNI